MGERACVILGDVIASRDVDDRDALGTALHQGLEQANTTADTTLHAPFTVLKGVDEIGGVLTTLHELYPVLRTIVEAIHPHEIRFGIAYDTIDIAPNSDDIAAMDGPAFHTADARLTDVTDTNRYVGLDLGDTPTPTVQTLLTNVCDLLFLWKNEWTPRQCEVVRTYRDHDTMTATGDTLGVSTDTVSRTLRRANAEPLLAIETDVTDAFRTLAGDDAV